MVTRSTRFCVESSTTINFSEQLSSNSPSKIAKKGRGSSYKCYFRRREIIQEEAAATAAAADEPELEEGEPLNPKDEAEVIAENPRDEIAIVVTKSPKNFSNGHCISTTGLKQKQNNQSRNHFQKRREKSTIILVSCLGETKKVLDFEKAIDFTSTFCRSSSS